MLVVNWVVDECTCVNSKKSVHDNLHLTDDIIENVGNAIDMNGLRSSDVDRHYIDTVLVVGYFHYAFWKWTSAIYTDR